MPTFHSAAGLLEDGEPAAHAVGLDPSDSTDLSTQDAAGVDRAAGRPLL